jgi:tetratricopeptide (TPR) repeat protein/DNA-binding MarR family transcriptional regulator
MTYIFTAEERILVHLLEFVKDQDSFEAPISVTQYGIGNRIGAGQDYVSRALKRLRQKELVNERRARVEGVRERRKVYFLTMAGIQEAQDIRKRMQRTSVKVMRDGKEDERSTVGQLLETLGEPIAELDVIRFTTEDGSCNIEDIREKRAADRVVDFSDKAPKLRHFFGRDSELSRMLGWLDTHKIIVVHGIAGIGKTALVARAVQAHKGEKNIFWYRFHEWDTLRNPLIPLSDLLSKLNRRRLKGYLASKHAIDLTELSYLLEEELKDANLLLVFDDFHKATGPIQQLFSIFVEILERVRGFQIILTTRHPVLFYDRREVMIKRIVAELSLKGLDEFASNQLLESRKIDETLFKHAYELTEGHPLALELLEPDGIRRRRDIHLNKYIEEEIFSKLSEQEREMLKIASVYRYPVQPKALFIDDSFVYETLSNLVNRSLIQEISFEAFDLHDFIREFFYTRLTPRERVKFHSKAAEYYLDMEGHRAWFEALYHLVGAKRFKDAADLAVLRGWELISKGYLEEFLELLNEIDDDAIEPHERGELYLVKARISDVIAEWDKALDFFNRSLDLVPEESRRMVAYWNIGWILQKRNEWEGSISNFQRCLDYSQSQNDTRGMAEAYHGLGRVLWRKGDWKESEEYLKKAVELGEDVDDKEIIASAYIELGRILAETGKLEEGRQCFEASLNVLKQIENPFETSRVYNCLGWEIFREQEDWESAKKALMKGMLIARDVGYTEGLGPVCHSLGELYARTGDYRKSEDYLSESLTVFNKLQDAHGIAYIYLSYGVLSRFQKKWEEAEDYFMMAVSFFEEVKSPFDIAYAKYEFGCSLLDKGDGKGAVRALEEAKNIFMRLGAVLYIERIDGLLGRKKKERAGKKRTKAASRKRKGKK